jgi:hypothetical protein
MRNIFVIEFPKFEKMMKFLIKNFATVLLMVLLNFTVSSAQISFGTGLAGMKYLGNGSNRPLAVGLNANLGIEFSEKTKLLLTPSFFVPVTYSYNEQLNINNVPTVTKTDEQFKTIQATALFVMDLIGNNKAGAFYVAVGPSVMFYNTTVTRENAPNYNYASSFKDYLLDARAGIEIPIGLIRIYAEAELGPAIISDFKNNNVYYKPNKGTLLAGTAGIRVRI